MEEQKPNQNPDTHEQYVLKLATIFVIGLVLLASVIGLTLIAVFTDKNVARAETYTFIGIVLLSCLGGLNWVKLRKHRHWHLHVFDEDKEDT